MKILLFSLFTAAAFAKTPSFTQTGAASGSDSIRLEESPVQYYDFYYSAKQAESYEKISLASYTLEDRVKKNRFRDKTFTQAVPKGEKVMSDFDDYVLIGSGTLAEIRPFGEW
ncbi:hypothetical protein GCM10027299_08970 [Larkinella ripae]